MSLWPTRLLQRVLPGAEPANAALESLILAEEESHGGSLTTDYQAQDFFARSHPVVEWLKTCINKSVGDYLAAQAINYDVRWSVQGWANINRQGDYHNLHNHPHSYLSGTYYVAVPEQSDTGQHETEQRATGQRSDLNPGAISFYDPRGQVNMNAIAGDGQIDPEYRLLPSPGMILLWPSFLMHSVHPNAAEAPRISISFNILLNRDAHQLPG